MSDHSVYFTSEYQSRIRPTQAVAFGLLVSLGIGASILIQSGLLGHLATTSEESKGLGPVEWVETSDASTGQAIGR